MHRNGQNPLENLGWTYNKSHKLVCPQETIKESHLAENPTQQTQLL